VTNLIRNQIEDLARTYIISMTHCEQGFHRDSYVWDISDLVIFPGNMVMKLHGDRLNVAHDNCGMKWLAYTDA
jgi:hypothetical protein